MFLKNNYCGEPSMTVQHRFEIWLHLSLELADSTPTRLRNTWPFGAILLGLLHTSVKYHIFVFFK